MGGDMNLTRKKNTMKQILTLLTLDSGLLI